MGEYRPALYLEPSDEIQAAVEKCMLGDYPGTALAARVLKEPSELGRGSIPHWDMDFSFARQMNAIQHNPQILSNNTITTGPEVILFTLRSAIPVADAVRGYYEAQGLPVPYLDTVDALSGNSAGGAKDSAITRLLNTAPEDNLKDDRLTMETRRLQAAIAGAGHVCVIDQYVQSGITLRLAGLLARRAGAKAVTGVLGRWYECLQPGEYDEDELTSPYSDFMHNIGHQAAHQTTAISAVNN